VLSAPRRHWPVGPLVEPSAHMLEAAVEAAPHSAGLHTPVAGAGPLGGGVDGGVELEEPLQAARRRPSDRARELRALNRVFICAVL
jgi:hypothetical protein